MPGAREPSRHTRRAVTTEAGFLRSARTVSLLTMCSRVLGMVRDVVTAHVLGNGLVNDALNLAWRVPNMFRRLFGEGALGTALVPELARVFDEQGPARARAVASEVVSTLAAFLIGLVGLLSLGLALVPDAPVAEALGVPLEKVRVTHQLLQLLLPYLAVVCVIAQFMAILHVMGEFAVPAFSPVLLNLVWIAGGLLAPRLAGGDLRQRGLVIAVSILLASVVQFAWHLPRLSALGMGLRPVLPRVTPELRAVAAALVPMLAGMGASQLNVVVDSAVAWLALPDGGVTHLYYGTRLMQFPLGLFAIALTTAVYPLLTRLAQRGDREGAAATFGFALRTNLLLVLPAAVGLGLLAPTLVPLIFQHGEFDAEGARRTAVALRGYAVGIPFAATAMLLTRAYYAVGDSTTPARIGLALVVVNALLDVLLVGPFAELGLAGATSTVSLLTALLLLALLRHRLDIGAWSEHLRGAGPTLAIAAVMGLVVWGADVLLARLVPPGRGGQLLRLGLDVPLGVVVVAVLAARWTPREYGALRGLFTSRD